MPDRKYKAPEGCTSISVNGDTIEVGKKGVTVVGDDVPHADMLTHGFTPLFGDTADDADSAALAAAKALEGSK